MLYSLIQIQLGTLLGGDDPPADDPEETEAAAAGAGAGAGAGVGEYTLPGSSRGVSPSPASSASQIAALRDLVVRDIEADIVKW